MSTLKVNAIRGTGASSDAISVNSTDGTCTAKITNNLSNRNIIINGAMMVAQRGTSTSTNGGFCCDRWKCLFEGNDEAPTFTQHALTSSDTGPWAKGFRKSLHVTNGNQTSGAGAADELNFYYQFEAQDLANSGWDYTSTSSYITFSFWVRSSVAQNFYGNIVSRDGSQQSYPFETGSLTANTWTKITKTIPGNANLQFDDDNGEGLTIGIYAFNGTNYTASGVSLDSWRTKSNSEGTPDMTTTWYTTNDATFEITGVQLEVGDVATDFEHRSYADELARCQRYYQNSYLTGNVPASSTSNDNAINLISWGDGNCIGFTFMGRMRAAPSVILRNPGATTVAKINSSGNDRAAVATNINDHHVKYIAVTSGTASAWAEVCYELNAEL